MTHSIERFHEKAGRVLGEAYRTIEGLVLSVDPDDDPENVHGDWMHSALCDLKTQIENVLAGVDEVEPDDEPDEEDDDDDG